MYKLVYNKVFCIDNIKNFEGEEWKLIEATNGNYYCSNLGRIKSYCSYSAVLLKPFNNKANYQKVRIRQYGISSNQFVHRIIGLT